MNEHLVLFKVGEHAYVGSNSKSEFICTPQAFLDILAWGIENGTNLLLLDDTNFAETFYHLSTGLAGEIVQKVSNYHFRLAIAGSFEKLESERFREFMAESNKGSQIHFARTKMEATSWLFS